MSTPRHCSDCENGTFARPCPYNYHANTKRLHRECSREYCHAPAAKMLRCFYRNGSHQSAFIRSFQDNKEAIPCGPI